MKSLQLEQGAASSCHTPTSLQEIKPPAQDWSLRFVDPEVEELYVRWMCASCSRYAGPGLSCILLGEVAILLQAGNLLPLIFQRLMWMLVASLSLLAVVVTVSPKSMRAFLPFFACLFAADCIASSFVRASLGAVSGIPPLIILQFASGFGGNTWKWCVGSIFFSTTVFFATIMHNQEAHPIDWMNLAPTVPLIFGSIISAILLEASSRRSFSSMHVVRQYQRFAAGMDCTSMSYASHDQAEDSDSTTLKGMLQTTLAINKVLEKSAADACKQLQAKQRFLATMSHEIRSPLHSIVALSGLIADDPCLEGDSRGMIQTVCASSQHLMSVVNDILDLSRVESGVMTLCSEPFELQLAVQEVIAIAAPSLQQGVELLSNVNSAEEIHLIGDVSRFKQVLCNLLSNACKFTHSGFIRLHVEVQPKRHEDDKSIQVYLTVEDTGIGMSSEFLERMYSPFEQSDNTISRKYGGTGLGLTITHQIIRLHGGSIQCRSKEKFGSTFAVQMPFHVGKGCRIPLASPPSGGTPPVRDCAFVIDAALSAPMQRSLWSWLKLTGAAVMMQAEYQQHRQVSSVISPTTKLTIIVTGQEGEVNAMKAMGQDNPSGRALVLHSGCTIAAAACKKDGVLSSRVASKMVVERAWMHVRCDLPLVGCLLLRAAAAIAEKIPASTSLKQSPQTLQLIQAHTSSFFLGGEEHGVPADQINHHQHVSSPLSASEVARPSLVCTSCSSSLEKKPAYPLSHPLPPPVFTDQNKAQPKTISSLKVLLVDDNSINRRVGDLLLGRCGVANPITMAENGQEALQAVKAAIATGTPFDVVLMDLHMPVMNGLEAAAEIFRIDDRAVVIGCTADTFLEDRSAMPLWLTKPFVASQLQATLEAAIRLLFVADK